MISCLALKRLVSIQMIFNFLDCIDFFIHTGASRKVLMEGALWGLLKLLGARTVGLFQELCSVVIWQRQQYRITIWYWTIGLFQFGEMDTVWFFKTRYYLSNFKNPLSLLNLLKLVFSWIYNNIFFNVPWLSETSFIYKQ